MSRKQGPRIAGKRPSAIADDRRNRKLWNDPHIVKEVGA